MSLVKGPFDLEWRGNVLAGIESASPSYAIASQKYETVQGSSYEVNGAHSASLEITLLETDIASLAAVLPQYHVANGGTLSTGEVVSDPLGAIDIVAGGCDAVAVTGGLIISSCGSPSQIARLVNASSDISGFEMDGKVRKVKVKFTGQPAQGEATLQFFKDGAISGVS